jgi:transcriptional regulator with XRE-family HTH domain
VPQSPSPVIANWELVLRLRERREQLGIGVNDITQRLGFTRNYWSAIENEHKIIPENTLRALFELLEFGEDDRGQLLELRESAKETGWWSGYSALFDGNIQRLFGLEHGAQQIHAYDTLLVPGLLQTPDYTREIMNSDTSIRPVEVEQRVTARRRRQERLHGADPLHLTSIISEAALRQQVGGPLVLRGQLDHLLSTFDELEKNVEIRVIPFTATSCNLFGAGTLSLLDFASPRLPRAAWHETVSTWGVISEPNKVRDITMAFNEALTRTLDRGETRKIIEKHRKELR